MKQNYLNKRTHLIKAITLALGVSTLFSVSGISGVASVAMAQVPGANSNTVKYPIGNTTAEQINAASKASNVSGAANSGSNSTPAGLNPAINYQAPSASVSSGSDLKGVNLSTTVVTPSVNGNTQVITQNAPNSLPGAGSGNGGGFASSILQGGSNSEQNLLLLQLLQTDPQSIRNLLKEIDIRKRAAKETANAKAVQESVNVYVTPGSRVPVIRTFANRTSAIVITDMHGAPWPIENFTLGASEDFVVHRLDKRANERGHMLDITPQENYVSGNLTMKLEGLDVPVVLEIISGQKEYDAPLTLKVMSKGPNSTYTSTREPEKVDNVLYSVLQGVAPAGLRPLKTESRLAQAWLSADGKSMYVRSNLSLMPFVQKTSSPDGTHVYKTTPMPIMTYSYMDKFGQIQIEGF